MFYNMKIENIMRNELCSRGTLTYSSFLVGKFKKCKRQLQITLVVYITV